MFNKLLGLIQALWKQFSFARYMGVHTVLGTLNYLVAFALIYLGFNHHFATGIGHFLHVGIGFFWDRKISFESDQTTVVSGGWKYVCIEALSYVSIVGTMYILIDLMQWNPYLVRMTFAAGIATLVSYGLNHVWTFKKK